MFGAKRTRRKIKMVSCVYKVARFYATESNRLCVAWGFRIVVNFVRKKLGPAKLQNFVGKEPGPRKIRSEFFG